MANNRVIVASAGSRKTTALVELALSDPRRRTLITTYTIENSQQVRDFAFQRVATLPPTLQILTWYTFLLRECVRPYQSYLYNDRRISNIYFSEGQSTRGIKKSAVARYYLHRGEEIYTDKISDFACRCNELSGGKVISRLERLYDQVLIDESQDLAGYDFDFLELMFRSAIQMQVVGDCRQATYFTNCSPRNKAYRGSSIVRLFADWEHAGLCRVEEWNESYRCIQPICDFADRLYPNLSSTISRNDTTTTHDGMFLVKPADVDEYYQRFHPLILRQSVRTNTSGIPAMNFGVAKGRTFDRVMIFPSGPIRKYLADAIVEALADRTRAGLYVAVTRARQSVAFVIDQAHPIHKMREYTQST